MKKILLSIFALMLAVFSVQAEEVKYQISSATAVTTNGTAPSGSTATFKNTYTSNKEQLTKGNSMTLTLKGYAGCKITGITLYMKSNKSAGSGSFTMKAGATELSAITATTFSNNNWNGAYTQNYTNVTPVMKNADYIIGDGEDVIITIAATVNSLYCQSFTITYEKVGGGETTEPEEPETPEVQAPAAPTLPESDNFDDTMTVEITNIADGATAYYSLNNDTNWTAGTSVKISETTTVYAKVVKDELSSGVVSATYTKNEPLPDGWIDDVLNRELTGVSGTTYSSWSGKTATSLAVYAGQSAGDKESIQLRSNNSNSGIVTTQSGGKAKKVVVVWNDDTADGRTLNIYGKNSAYTEATNLYNISNQGTLLGTIVKGTSTEFVIVGDYEYIGLRSNSGAMYLTSVSITWDASAGVTVIPDAPEIPATSDFVTSMDFEITNFSAYEDGTTVYYSIDDGDAKEYTAPFKITTSCKIVAYAVNGELKSAESTAEYTRIANDPVITVVGDTDADAFEESIEVEIGTQNGVKAYYTLNNEEPTEESTEYEGTLTIKATATLKVIAIEEGKYRSKNVVAKTFTMALKDTSVDDDASSATFDATNQGYENQADIASEIITDGITVEFNKGTNNSNGPKYYSSGTAIRCYGGNKFTITSTVGTITKIVLTYGNSDGSNEITTDCGEFSTNTWVGNSNSVVFTIGGTSGNRRIQKITVTYGEPENESYSLNVTEAGWATLYLGYNVVIPDGVTCYVISGVSEESVQLEEVAGILPANTAAIVNAEKGEYTFEPTKDKNENTINNLMLGTTNNKYIEEDAYVLGIVDDEVGLYKAKKAGGVWLNNANKAYLPASAVPASAALSAGFRFDFSGTTGVEKVEIRNEKEEIYDLTGRRVNEITKAGVYVVNGKKILVK